MSKFFINRPIVALVIAILMVIVGVVTIVGLPVAQFPNIAPPEIRLSAVYVGADAKTLEEAVATPIEQQVNGVDKMDYMYSTNATNNRTLSCSWISSSTPIPTWIRFSPSLASSWRTARFPKRSSIMESTSRNR